MKLINKENFIAAIPTAVAVILIAGFRLIPHPWNFAPVGAAAIFGGMYLKKYYAIALPLLAMFVADAFIGFSWIDVPFVYGSLVLSALIGIWIGKDRTSSSMFAFRTLGGSVASSFLFFLITNFGAWLALETYSKDAAGLIQAYVMAIPFFGNTLAGDMFFIAVFVAGYEFLQWAVNRKLNSVVVRPGESSAL